MTVHETDEGEMADLDPSGGRWATEAPPAGGTAAADAPSPDGRPMVSLVVPVYNESAVLTENLTALARYMTQLEDMYRWEMIVVNDGSSDDSGDLAETFARGCGNVVLLHHAQNMNLGQALRTAFERCRGDFVVTFDCDLSYAPEHIGRLITELSTTDAKIVIASPYHRRGRTTSIPLLRRVLSRGANRFLSRMVRGKISTLTGMVRGYDRRFLDTLNLKSMDTEINTEILYKAQLLGATVLEIPAHLDWTLSQTGGRRRRSPVKLASSANSYLFSGFMFRPGLFFIAPGLALLAAGTYTSGWVCWRLWNNFLERTNGGLDARITDAVSLSFSEAPHAFYVAGFTLMLAFQLISLGIIALQSDRYFKELFHFNTSIYRELKRSTSKID